MANWERVLTVEDDADYKNTSIEAANLPAHSGALITSGTVAAGRVATLNQNTSGSSATCSGLAGSATVLATQRAFQTNLANQSGAFFTGAANCTPGVTGTLPAGNGGTGLTSISTLLNSNVTSVSGNAGTVTNGVYTTSTIAVNKGGTGATATTGTGSNVLSASPSFTGTVSTAALEVQGEPVLNGANVLNDISGNLSVAKGGTGLTSTSTLLNSNVTSVSGNAGSATVLSNTRTFRTNLASTSTSNFNGSQNPTPGVTGTLPVTNGGTGQTSVTGTGKLVLWDSPSLNGSPIIGGTTFPSSTGTAKQILQNNGLGSATWADNFPNNVKYFYQQWSMRWYMRYGYAYYPSTSYGPGYYNWNKYSISPITSWLDSWNLGYVVPESATFKGAELLGSTNNTETLQLKILKGTPSSNNNSSTSVTIGSIYAPTAESFTSGLRNSMGSTSAVTVSVSKGDIIVPQLNKTSNINSTTRYLYGTLVLKFEKV